MFKVCLGGGVKRIMYLNRSVHIWKFDAKVDLAGYREADEQPVVETEVVDQLENVRHGQV